MIQYQPPAGVLREDVTEEVDWRKHNAVTHVHEQVQACLETQ